MADDDEEMQRFVPIEDLFKGRLFDRQTIVLSVSWHTSFKLSLGLVIMMADREISVTQQRFLPWVQRYLPEFEKCWWRYARPSRNRDVNAAQSFLQRNAEHSRANEDHVGRLGRLW